MDVRDAIEGRRAYRSFNPVAITDDLVWDLARAAQVSQPHASMISLGGMCSSAVPKCWQRSSLQ